MGEFKVGDRVRVMANAWLNSNADSFHEVYFGCETEATVESGPDAEGNYLVQGMSAWRREISQDVSAECLTLIHSATEKMKEEGDTMNQPEYISVSDIRIGDTIRVMGPEFKVADIDDDGDPCDEAGDYVGGLYLKEKGHDVLLISRNEPKLPTETGSIIRDVRLAGSAVLAPMAVLNAEGLWYLPHLDSYRQIMEPDEIVSWRLDGDDDDSDNND